MRSVPALLCLLCVLFVCLVAGRPTASECEKAALEHVKAHPEAGRVLARGEDLVELPALEKKFGPGRWCKAVLRKADECGQTCALVQYFWEKKSNKVVEATLLKGEYSPPKPCHQKQQQQQQQQNHQNRQQQQGQPPRQPEPVDEAHDYYKILGIAKTADKQDIKRAYRKLAMKWHPDKNPDNRAEAEEKFKSISEAYQVLNDDEKRKEYDTYGPAGAPRGPGGPHPFATGVDPQEIFRTFFGGGMPGGEGSGGIKFTFNMGGGGGEPQPGFGGFGGFPGGFPGGAGFGGPGEAPRAQQSTGGGGGFFGNMFGNMFGGGGGPKPGAQPKQKASAKSRR